MADRGAGGRCVERGVGPDAKLSCRELVRAVGTGGGYRGKEDTPHSAGNNPRLEQGFFGDDGVIIPER